MIREVFKIGVHFSLSHMQRKLNGCMRKFRIWIKIFKYVTNFLQPSPGVGKTFARYTIVLAPELKFADYPKIPF